MTSIRVIIALVGALVVALCLLAVGIQGKSLREAQAALKSANSALETKEKVAVVTDKVVVKRAKEYVVIEKAAAKQEVELKEAIAKHEDVSSIVLPDDILNSLR